jgi:hypothetical protein
VAARTLRPKHSDEVRAKIQASMLIRGLQDNFEGKKNLTAGQIKSAEILLRKSVPDLSSIELSSDPDKPVQIVSQIRLVDMAPNE